MDFHKDHLEMSKRGRKCSNADGLPIMGFIFLGLGLVFLFDRLGLIPEAIRHIIMSWQALLIFIGTINLMRRNSRFPGLILILVGGAFLIPRIIEVPFETSQLIWPIILITIGLFIVLKTKRIKQSFSYSRTDDTPFTSGERIEEVAIFGGTKRIITSKNLKGGNITAVFGGVELDLSEADFDGDIAVINVEAIFGGATLVVKPEWDIQLQITSIMGGFADKRKVYKGAAGTKTLVIKGAAIFGGGEVKSF